MRLPQIGHFLPPVVSRVVQILKIVTIKFTSNLYQRLKLYDLRTRLDSNKVNPKLEITDL